MLELILVRSLCRVRKGRQRLGIQHVIAKASLEQEVQV